MSRPGTELNPGDDPLRRYASRVVDHLANARPRTLRRLVGDVLAGLLPRLRVEHIHLYAVRGSDTATQTFSLWATASATGTELPGEKLHRVPLPLLSSPVVEGLQHGLSTFVPLNRAEGGSGRLVSGLLREIGSTGYVLCPIHLTKRLRGIWGIAHREGADHLDAECCRQLRLTGKLLVQSIQSVQRESRQRRGHRQWKKVADAACDFALVVDSTGEIRQVIPFGAARTPPVIGLRLQDFVLSQYQADVDLAVRQAVSHHELRTCSLKGVGVDGRECWYHVRVEPQSRSGEPSVTLFLSDIGAQQTQHEQLQKLQDHLHRASRLSLLGQISTEFAHQINQPLQAIMTYCETMRSREQSGTATPQKRQASLASILASVEQATSIVVRIREFSQRRALRLDACSLPSIIDRAVVIARPRADECGVQLIDRTSAGFRSTADDAHGMEHMVLVDDVQTIHVLINLFVNAVEACQQSGRVDGRVEVSVEVASDHRYFLVRVSDNGPGLPPDNPQCVFEKFRTTKAEGLGIGLAISRAVIESQYGQIWAENNDSGLGCSFCFTVRRCGRQLSDTDEVLIISGSEPPAD